jgi:hypothetical protein
LHTEDITLVVSGILSLDDLVTVRKGEYVYQPLADDPRPARQELVKIRGQGADWSCVFLDNEQSVCTIYSHRPLACRLLKCWSPEDVLAVAEKNLLDRLAIIPETNPMVELICGHEEKCPVTGINSLVEQLHTPEGRDNVLGELIRLVNVDLKVREYAVREYRLSLARELFYFGRPLFQLLAPFGLSAIETPDGVILQYRHT